MRTTDELIDNAAESGVIATLIYHPDFLLIDNILRETFFYNKENQAMFWAIRNLVAKGVTNIDVLNLENMLASNPSVYKLIKERNMTDLQKYMNLAKAACRGTYEEFRLLMNNVIACAFRRELHKVAEDIGRECFNTTLTLDDLNEFVNNGINGLAERFIFGSDTVQFGEKVDSIWEEICNDRNDDGTFGIPSKIPSLNEYFTYGNGELVLVAGQTGKGKSSLFLNEAVYNLQRGIPVVIVDSELTDKVYLPRLLAAVSGVAVKTIKTGKYNNDEEKRVKDALEWIKHQSFVHEYEPIFSKIKTEQICRKWKNQGKLGFLVYDYIKPSERYGAADISQSLGIMADFLKSMAGNLDIPVLAGLQLNKFTNQTADSQKPERYGDVLLYWKEKTVEQLQRDGLECGNFCMQVVKNRNGMVHDEEDYVDISFNGNLMKIVEAKKHEKHEDTPFENEKKKTK